MKQKRIVCRGHCPIFNYPDYQQPWADVWISFRTRPNKPHYYGPTLLTKKCVERDLKSYLELQEENPELDWSYEIELERIQLKLLETEEIIVEIPKKYSTMGEIITNKEYIDRKEAERMLTYYVNELGYKNLKFIWKRSKFIATPV